MEYFLEMLMELFDMLVEIKKLVLKRNLEQPSSWWVRESSRKFVYKH
jgi:hypothetical protein